VLAEDDVLALVANRDGGEDFVGEGVGEDAVLVDAGGVGEGVGTDDRLVRCGAEADAAGEHLAGGEEFGHDDVVGVGELVFADHEDGRDLFEGGVAGAFANAVDGAFDLADSGFDGGDGVGYGEAEIVVAVCGEDDVFRPGDAVEDHAKHGGVVLRDAVADGVGEVEGGGAGLDGDFADFDEDVGVSAGGVFGNSTSSQKVRAKATISAIWSMACLRVMRSLAARWRSEVERKVWMRLEGAGSMARAAASMSSRLQRARAVILGPRTSLAMARTDSRSPCEAMGKPLFGVVHGAAGGLLAVAEGGVEEDDVVAGRHKTDLSFWTES
jgi:hypothetical protein